MKEAISHLLPFLRDPGVIRNYGKHDWNRLVSQARFHDLMPLLDELVCRDGLQNHLPKELEQLLDGYCTRLEYLHRLYRWELEKLNPLAEQAGFPVVMLKGMAYLMAKMGSWRSRSFADIDILVAQENFTAFEQVLREHGWDFKELNEYDDRYYRQWSHASPPLINRDSGIELDLHHHVSAPISDQPVSTDALMERLIKIEESAFFRLGDADLILHCANHFIYFDDLQGKFKDLVLIYFIVQKADAPALFEALYQRAEELGLSVTLYYLIGLLQHYFDTPVPEAIKTRLAHQIKARPLRAVVLALLKTCLTPENVDSLKFRFSCTLLITRYQWTRYPLKIFLYHLFRKHVFNRISDALRQRG